MKARFTALLILNALVLVAGPKLYSQAPADVSPAQSDARGPGQRPDDGRPRPLIGQISAIAAGTLKISKPDGSTTAVVITDKTDFRKDRQPAKLSDFKVGDFVLVRGAENADHSVNAEVIAGRTGGGANAGRSGGRGGMNGTPMGTMGKDFVVGEVKSIDAPKITLLRPDNVTQTIELNEETSLRKGRDSITMADIAIGDHIFARGASQGDAFNPKNVMVISPEQWKRMEDAGFTETAPQGGNAPKSQDQKPAGPGN
jgi:hypothetical protein